MTDFNQGDMVFVRGRRYRVAANAKSDIALLYGAPFDKDLKEWPEKVFLSLDGQSGRVATNKPFWVSASGELEPAMPW